MTSSNAHRITTESKLTDSLGFRLIVTALFVAVAFAITGCSGSFDPKLSGGEPATGASGITFKGHIQGGQAPIYAANIYVFQTGELGYPGPGVVANQSIITSTAAGTFNGAVNGNSYGAHVNTDSNGNFSFTLNNCTPGAGVYIVSYGGQPIFGTQNIAAGEMASMGVCPATSTTGLFANNPFVNVNEVSTVAFAYAVGGFTAAGYDFSHISTSATNLAAMQNAFNLAQQLFSISTTGGANTGSATMPGATFPAAKINTMANIVADCINSGGVTGSSSPCYTLLENATSNGTAGSGVIPSDTASALINITHYVQSNVSAIYALASNIYAPYSPTLTAQPSDFVMSIDYYASAMYDPYQVAIDGNGNVYALSDANSSREALRRSLIFSV
jgi:hypothetical protein